VGNHCHCDAGFGYIESRGWCCEKGEGNAFSICENDPSSEACKNACLGSSKGAAVQTPSPANAKASNSSTPGTSKAFKYGFQHGVEYAMAKESPTKAENTLSESGQATSFIDEVSGPLKGSPSMHTKASSEDTLKIAALEKQLKDARGEIHNLEKKYPDSGDVGESDGTGGVGIKEFFLDAALKVEGSDEVSLKCINAGKCDKRGQNCKAPLDNLPTGCAVTVKKTQSLLGYYEKSVRTVVDAAEWQCSVKKNLFDCVAARKMAPFTIKGWYDSVCGMIMFEQPRSSPSKSTRADGKTHECLNGPRHRLSCKTSKDCGTSNQVFSKIDGKEVTIGDKALMEAEIEWPGGKQYEHKCIPVVTNDGCIRGSLMSCEHLGVDKLGAMVL